VLWMGGVTAMAYREPKITINGIELKNEFSMA
jgi:hypothetical protein